MMPIMSKTYRKSFKWREVDGVPVAQITTLNGRGWILCCPLCGCLHETRLAQIAGAFKPDCLLRKLAAMQNMPSVHIGADWARLLADWQDAHPGAATHDTVLLLDGAAVSALDKQQRKAAAAAKRAAAKQTTENTMPMASTERKTA